MYIYTLFVFAAPFFQSPFFLVFNVFFFFHHEFSYLVRYSFLLLLSPLLLLSLLMYIFSIFLLFCPSRLQFLCKSLSKMCVHLLYLFLFYFFFLCTYTHVKRILFFFRCYRKIFKMICWYETHINPNGLKIKLFSSFFFFFFSCVPRVLSLNTFLFCLMGSSIFHIHMYTEK